jgi:hypothetical protein
MRKLLAISLVGFATVGAGAPRTAAWFGDHKCCANICCRQYNAFSPFCCDGAVGGPMPGYGYGGSPACSFPGGEGNLGELPAPGMIGGPVTAAPITPPANGAPTARSPIMAPGYIQGWQPGGTARPGPAWGTGMTNPGGVPGSYPGYAPANGTGAPPYYPGVMGYGTAAPPYYPGATGYGPANGFAR